MSNSLETENVFEIIWKIIKAIVDTVFDIILLLIMPLPDSKGGIRELMRGCFLAFYLFFVVVALFKFF